VSIKHDFVVVLSCCRRMKECDAIEWHDSEVRTFSTCVALCLLIPVLLIHDLYKWELHCFLVV